MCVSQKHSLRGGPEKPRRKSKNAVEVAPPGARKHPAPPCLYSARMNLERRGSSSASCGLDGCVALPATRVSVEKARNASETLIVPRAEERRPEKGSSSGERPHCVFRLTRPTAVASTSTRGAAAAAERVKMAACWPQGEIQGDIGRYRGDIGEMAACWP